MSDDIKSITVILDGDYKEYMLENLKTSIGTLKGVASVELNSVTFEDHLSRSRVKSDIKIKFLEFWNSL